MKAVVTHSRNSPIGKVPTANEYHEGVEACYRLAGETKTETDRLA